MFLLTTGFMGITLTQILATPISTSTSTIINSSTLVPCGAGTSETLNEARLFDLLQAVLSPIETSISFIADGILIYRCVVLWPQRLGRWVGMVLGTLLLAETVTGFTAVYFMTELYFLERQQTASSKATLTPRWIKIVHNLNTSETANNFLALAVNVLATILIASRIWFMARQLEMTLGRTTGVRYRAAMSMIIESGLLVTASQLAIACTTVVDSIAIYGGLIITIVQMLTVIAPTLIIVRVGMGQGFDSVVETAHEHHASRGIRESQVRSIRFASHPTTTAEGSHLATFEANPRSTGSESDADSRSNGGHEHSDVRKEAEDANAEKAEATLV
ncbi:hypothetical protein EVG20_g803 [Dentipellis fragilis]|uniref:Uncharacterized protein n=1 Tax=Dentipellis fragilis TaxID=205917 RepID=A0A4Y9ZCH9_9AGAM|nr:hypothetical protein EVG20_g803 [Dentipellis fragilis]